MSLWEVKSIRTGNATIMNDTELQTLKKSGIASRYKITKIEPIKPITPFVVTPPKEVKKAKTKKQ